MLQRTESEHFIARYCGTTFSALDVIAWSRSKDGKF